MSAAAARRRDRLGSILYYGALAGLATLFAAPLGIAWLASSAMLRPPWYVHPGPGAALPDAELRDPRSNFGLDYRDVAFESEAGATLRGWWMPADDARRCAVLLAGGGWSDRRSLLPLAPVLHAGGYGVLAFDYREHGQSDGSGRGASFGWRESRDVEAAVRFLKAERGAARVAVVGYSIGGAAAILAAADDPSIDAVVASTPGTTLRDLFATAPETRDVPAWQRELVVRVLLLRIGAPWRSVVSGEIGPLYAVDRIAPRPLLLLHGRNDPINAVADAQRLLARARPPRQLLIVGGAGHLDVLDDPHAEAQQQLVRFLDERFCPDG